MVQEGGCEGPRRERVQGGRWSGVVIAHRTEELLLIHILLIFLILFRPLFPPPTSIRSSWTRRWRSISIASPRSLPLMLRQPNRRPNPQ